MASIEINKHDLEKLVGKRLDSEKLQDNLFDMKLELDRIEDENLIIEVEYDRADMLSTEGIARQMKGYFGSESGLIKYEFKPSKSEVKISEEMKKYRPYAQYFIALNVPFDSAAIKQIMQIQEKLHFIYAQDRTKASIGVYDLDKTSKQFEYKPTEPEKISFVPLESKAKMNGRDILQKHPKGAEYAHLLEHMEKYPLLSDCNGKVLSMPPIINSEDTKVDENTKNLFVDVTGIDERVVNKITVILATMLAERGAEVRTVKIEYGTETTETPKLEYNEMKLRALDVRRILGLNLSETEIMNLLKKARYGCEMQSGLINVIIPCYRFDVMHPVDLIEDVAINYGLNNMKPIMPNVATIGEIHPIEKRTNKFRELMIGLGFQETGSFVLSNKEKMTAMTKNLERPVELENYSSLEYNCMRNSLISKILDIFKANKHRELPQKVFEAGDVVHITNKGETKTRTAKNLCAGICSAEAGFTEIKSNVQALLSNAGIKTEYKEIKQGEEMCFLSGRCAEVYDLKNGKKIGVLGEIHPEILQNFELENPIALFEIEIDKLL
ncbi:MAG: phenylalanine--tRNA ligase subunit beta [Candidatus Micrarchaeota archaeon]